MENQLVITRIHKGDYKYIYYLMYQEKLGLIGGDLAFLKFLSEQAYTNEQIRINENDYIIFGEWIDCKYIFEIKKKGEKKQK